MKCSPNDLDSQPANRGIDWEDATLDCNTEAYPMSINYWTKENSMMIVSNSKYITSIQDNTYKVHMKLTVVSVRPEDYGTYKCSARNSLGTTDGSIRLYRESILM
ncbi:hypothetical protein CEXT_328131 [Caerostris extrusa]|uniref:Ig-like domain-containing protein n=1 Tax=Caerostris extrusa TaxID=172846 RepID=A0AAV4XGR2_CAEEX|nr:hypothetical protein CEXT_328131 [Caerostris extrusa]